MILVKDLSIERSNIKIFENVNLSLGSGKIILLKGKNGSGKTTLLKAILNLIEPTFGSIYWKGKLLKKNFYVKKFSSKLKKKSIKILLTIKTLKT